MFVSLVREKNNTWYSGCWEISTLMQLLQMFRVKLDPWIDSECIYNLK